MAELTQGPNLYQYVHNGPATLVDPLGLYDHTAQETAAFMRKARADAKSGPLSGLIHLTINHFPFGPYDIKTKYPEEDTFLVGKRKLSPSEFGNFLAGYAGASYGLSGYVAMREAGIIIDALDFEGTYLDDDGSAVDINLGALRALLEALELAEPCL
jgi:hypothetical protein